MGAKAKKARMKKLKKNLSGLSTSIHREEAADFLPLEGGPGHKLPQKHMKIRSQSCILVESHMVSMRMKWKVSLSNLVQLRGIELQGIRRQENPSILASLNLSPPRWKGVNRWYKPLDWVRIERKQQDKERTLEEHKKLVEGIKKQDQKRRKRIEAAGIDYDCPEIVGSNPPASKKIRCDEE